MYDNNSKGISYTAGFFILIAFAIAGQILGAVILIPIWQQMTGLDYKAMADNLNNPAYADFTKVGQAVNAIVGFFIPSVVTAFLLNRKPMRLLGFSPRIKLSQAGLAILIIGVGLMVSTSLAYFNKQIPIPSSWAITFDKWENEYNDAVKSIISLNNTKDYIIALVLMAFLPALGEEALFRGGLQNFLSRSTRMPWLSIILVSALFSAFHISYYGFLSRFFLGLVLGAIYYYSGKLWLSILAHFVNNAIALTMIYVMIRQGNTIEEAMKDDVTSLWGIVFLPVVIGLFILFKKVSADRQPA